MGSCLMGSVGFDGVGGIWFEWDGIVIRYWRDGMR